MGSNPGAGKSFFSRKSSNLFVEHEHKWLIYSELEYDFLEKKGHQQQQQNSVSLGLFIVRGLQSHRVGYKKLAEFIRG